MAWCRQATSHCLSKCWYISMSPWNVIWSQWVKAWPLGVLCHWSSRASADQMLSPYQLWVWYYEVQNWHWIFVSKWVPVMNSCPCATLSRPRCLHSFELIFNTKPTFLAFKTYYCHILCFHPCYYVAQDTACAPQHQGIGRHCVFTFNLE